MRISIWNWLSIQRKRTIEQRLIVLFLYTYFLKSIFFKEITRRIVREKRPVEGYSLLSVILLKMSATTNKISVPLSTGVRTNQ